MPILCLATQLIVKGVLSSYVDQRRLKSLLIYEPQYVNCGVVPDLTFGICGDVTASYMRLDK